MPNISKIVDVHTLNKLLHSYHVVGHTEQGKNLKKKYVPGYKSKGHSMNKTSELNWIYSKSFKDELEKINSSVG